MSAPLRRTRFHSSLYSDIYDSGNEVLHSPATENPQLHCRYASDFRSGAVASRTVILQVVHKVVQRFSGIKLYAGVRLPANIPAVRIELGSFRSGIGNSEPDRVLKAFVFGVTQCREIIPHFSRLRYGFLDHPTVLVKDSTRPQRQMGRNSAKTEGGKCNRVY